MKFDKHMFWMIIACVLPIILIFIAPALGIKGNVTFFVFIVAIFAIHLLIPMHNHSGHRHTDNDSDLINSSKTTLKNNDHEQHQH